MTRMIKSPLHRVNRGNMAAIFLLTALLPAGAGCGLLALPMALVNAALSVAAIPLNLAASLIGPATNAAATAAPYALMLAKQSPGADAWDVMIFENASGHSESEFRDIMKHSARQWTVARAYPSSEAAWQAWLRRNKPQCYLVRV